MADLRALVRKLVPLSVRVAIDRARRMPEFRAEAAGYRFEREPKSSFGNVVTERRSPLLRDASWCDPELQRGKETNVRIAAGHIDGLVIPPGATFSYHHAVGPPTRRRGFVPGAELRDGRMSAGVGGGCCQISNMLYLLALESGATIVERHRHGLDLFPDADRTAPFACGATVFFPRRDLKFRNELDVPIRIGLRVEDECLVGEISTASPLEARWEVFETSHDLRQEGEMWIRENRIARRRIVPNAPDEVEEVALNVAVCLYDPT